VWLYDEYDIELAFCAAQNLSSLCFLSLLVTIRPNIPPRSPNFSNISMAFQRSGRPRPRAQSCESLSTEYKHHRHASSTTQLKGGRLVSHLSQELSLNVSPSLIRNSYDHGSLLSTT